MKLYFLRHGIAAGRDEWSGSDEDRPLNAEGRKEMEREAKGMADLNVYPDCIITSPLKRAKETAEIVADRLDLKTELVQDERLAGAFDVPQLERILRDHRDAETVMLVGHEPHFSHTIGQLIGGGGVDLKKGGLARIELRDRSTMRGELEWLLPPKALMR